MALLSAQLGILRLNAGRLDYITGPPLRPTGPTPKDGAIGVKEPIVLAWAANDGADYYAVDIGGQRFYPTSPTMTLPANFAKPGAVLHWRVTAVNQHGQTQGPTWRFTVYRRSVGTRLSANLNGTWSELTRDVLIGTLDLEYGLTGNRPTDSLASSGTLRFALRNDNGNTGKREGYYSPYHINCRPGWAAGIDCRLWMAWESMPVTSVTRSGSTVTVDTSAPHGLTNNSAFVITGATPADYNGLWYAVTAPTTTRVTFTIATSPASPATGSISLENGRVRFWGRINDIDPAPGRRRARRVEVIAYDRMKDLLDSDLLTIALATNKTEAQLLDAILYALDPSVRPRNWQLDAGIDQIPVAFDDIGEGVRAGALAADIIRSSYGLGFIYGDGVFRYVSRNTRATVQPSFAIDQTMVDVEAAVSIDKAFNVVRTTTHPRTIDATPVVLWAATGTPPFVAPSETLTIEGTFHSPSDVERLIGAASTLALVAGTDWAANATANGSGTNLTANLTVTPTVSAARVSFAITNNGGTGAHLVNASGQAFLQIRGTGIYDNGPRTFTTQSTRPYGVRSIALDLPYQNVDATGKQIADLVHAQYAPLTTQVERVTLRLVVEHALYYHLFWREIGDALTLSESVTGLASAAATILGVRLTWLTDQILEGHWLLGPVVALKPPAMPTNVSTTVLSDTGIRVTWTTATPGSYTQLYFNGIHVGTAGIGATSMDVQGLTPLAWYSVTLRHMYFGMPSPFTAGVWQQPRVIATGGTTYDSGGYRYHVFTANGNFVITAAGTVDVFLVGGGGGGGGGAVVDPGPHEHGGGGGGGGELRELFDNFEPIGTHVIVIGQGGGPGSWAQNFGGNGTDGTDTTYRTERAGHGGNGAGANGGRNGGGGACGGGASGNGGEGPGGKGGSATVGHPGGDAGSNPFGSTPGAGGGGMTSAGGPAASGIPGTGRTAFDGNVYGHGGYGGKRGRPTSPSLVNSGKGGDGGQAGTNSGHGFAGAAGKVVIRYRV